MKNSTLIALHEANELPETLLKEWSNKSHATPIADAQHEITKHEGSMLTGTFLMGMGIFAMGGDCRSVTISHL